MTIRITPKAVLIAAAVFLVGVFIWIRVAKQPHGVDQQAVAKCTQEVDKTYQTLLDTSDLVAPKTGQSIQEQEQAAKAQCVTSNTH